MAHVPPGLYRTFFADPNQVEETRRVFLHRQADSGLGGF
jgi:hypothetical protein